MKKIKTLIKSPCLTMSGYGTDSRQRIKSLLADPKYDVYLEPLNWGNTPFMSEDTEERRVLKSLIQKRIVEQHNGDNKFDLFIHITIPNEFERLGTYNVGITAGTETTKVSHTWLEKCNQMDLIIVPSEHTKKAFVDSVYEGQNQQTGQKVTLKLDKPIVVCPEGVNTEIFNNLPTTSKIIDDCLSEAPDFNFLCVGQWANGGYGEDRKNIANHPGH